MDPLEASFDANMISSTGEKMHILAPNKFILMCIASLGLYGLWWMYKAWRFFKKIDRSDITPAARAIFAIFFIHALFERIKMLSQQEVGFTPTYSSSSLTAGFFIANITGRLPGPFALIALLGSLLLIQPYKAWHFALLNSSRYSAEEQVKFSDRQLIVLAVGVVLFVLIAIGLFVE
jgi:hypothetical protein